MSSFGSVPIYNLKKKFGLTGFIETGTSEGALAVKMAVGAGFDRAASCEIHADWARTAAKQFADDERVRIYRGLSKEALPLMIQFIDDRPTMFWLDAHFPPGNFAYADTEVLPLKDEIDILKKKPGIEKDVICIDDLRLFDLDLRPKEWSFPILITRDEIEKAFPKHESFVIAVPDVILVLQPRGN